MAHGKVKWFNEKKGYGFIQIDGDVGDAFAHYSNIQGEGFKTLMEGQEVEFDVVQDVKGVKAMNITLFRTLPPPNFPSSSARP